MRSLFFAQTTVKISVILLTSSMHCDRILPQTIIFFAVDERGVCYEKSWLTRFSRAARWYLPPEEAEEVVADYTDLLAEDDRPERALERDLGRPRKAAALLAQKKEYVRWLIAFGVMAAAVLPMALSTLDWFYPLSNFFADLINWGGTPVWEIFLLAGGLTALLWFQRQGRREPALPRRLILFLILEALCLGIDWYLGRQVLYGMDPVSRWMFGNPFYTVSLATLVRMIVEGVGFLAGLAALYGLWKARTEDRRWRAVYLLGLTGLALFCAVMSVMQSMNLSGDGSWRDGCFQEWLMITLAGLLGTGVGLC